MMSKDYNANQIMNKSENFLWNIQLPLNFTVCTWLNKVTLGLLVGSLIYKVVVVLTLRPSWICCCALENFKVDYLEKKIDIISRRFIDLQTLTGSVSDERQCDICFYELNMGYIKELPCGHAFHTICVETWQRRSCTCPTCRLALWL